MTRTADQLRSIKNFDQLIPFLEEDLEWPFPHGRAQYDFEDLTFQYSAEEVGLEAEYAAKIKSIHQLRPLVSGQPWGIFFVEFENKKLPIVVLRRILSHLVLKKRKSANPAERARWNAGDLIFISAFAEEGTLQREIAFAHFHQDPGDQPTLRVLGWDGGDTPLKLEHVAQILKQRLSWPNDTSNHELWRKQWAGAFRYRIGQQIQTAALLAQELARVARNIRDAAMALMRVESARGPLRKMHEAFRTALIHDLDQNGFADTYAQTITYGLLTAAISRTDRSAGAEGTFVLAEDLHSMVPITNPFLKEMLESFLKVGGRDTTRNTGLDFDELGVQDVVELLRSSDINLPAVLEDFGNRNPGEDPVIRFYEDFLKAYNRELKIKRGVFYTPQPVVSYIVRSVHELLRTDFDIEDGLASTVTWGEMTAKHAELAIPAGSKASDPFVVILDPATGTATFLVEVIDVIYNTLVAKWKQERLTSAQREAAWNEYVPKHLLPRLHGYELLMAPYAIAHMKIGLKLYETGYKFGNDERARIYLTNTLEPPSDNAAQMTFAEWVPALAHEAQAVNAIKRLQNFTVIVGNPPYAGLSANLTPVARAIVERYKYIDGVRIREKGALQFEKNLQDDYVKFFAWSEKTATKSGVGILSFISNNGFLETPTLRGMRWNLLNSFSALYVLDLHGSAKRPVEGDQNVFDIQQGVAISLLGKGLLASPHVKAQRADILGDRTSKYTRLSNSSLRTTDWTAITPAAPFYQFLASDGDLQTEYNGYVSLPEAMPEYSSGTETGFDSLMVDFTKAELQAKLSRFLDPRSSYAHTAEEFSVGEGTGRKLLDMRTEFREDFDANGAKYCTKGMYRVFDARYYYYKKEYLKTNSHKVMRHLADGKNIAMVAFRQQSQDGFQHIFVTNLLGDKNAVSLRTREINYYFPLLLFPVRDGLGLKTNPVPNFSADFLCALSRALELERTAATGLPKGLTPEKIFHYAYAVFHSPSYRARYAEFLKTDFPRLPLTGDLGLLNALALMGGKLASLHTMDLPETENSENTYIGSKHPLVERITYSQRTVWLDNEQTSGFKDIPEAVWEFHIGGYQVCEKWLKDRRGRRLSKDDIAHYGKIVAVLGETIRLMKKIDEVIDEHGGWPGAFASSIE